MAGCNWSGPLQGDNRGYACVTCGKFVSFSEDMTCPRNVQPVAEAPEPEEAAPAPKHRKAGKLSIGGANDSR